MWQILERDKPGDPWRFVAHGARYDKARASDMVRRIKQRGGGVRLIFCGKPR